MRYPEKRYLAEYDLSSDFFSNLNINVKDIIPLRKVFILDTTNGKVILKKIDYSEERLKFINECIEKIYEKFPYIITFKSFEGKKNYIKRKDNIYVLMDLLPGREVAFTNPIEFNKCVKMVATMHLISNKLVEEIAQDLGNNVSDIMEESLIKKYKDALIEFSEIKQWIERFKYRNEFDGIVIEIIDKYMEEMKEAIKLLNFSSYGSYRKKKCNLVVCHNDLAEHNFLISDDKVNIIDFDYCNIDMRVMDIADIVLKGIKNVVFDVDKAINAIEEYNKIYPLDEEEYKYIYILLSFPRDIYSIIKNYYYKEKNWDEEVFINRLKNKLSNEEFRYEFLKKYKEFYEKKFY